MSITKAADFDNSKISKVTFSDVKKLGKGKMVYVNYNSGKIILQTPKMNVPFGLSRWRDPSATDNSGDSFRLPLSFYGEESSNDIKKFKENMEQFDNIIKQKIQQNSSEWLGKKNVSMEAIESAFYAPNVKISEGKDGKEYPSRFEIKLDRQKDSNDNFTGNFVSNKKADQPILIFDENKERLDLNENNYDAIIPKGSHAICLIELVYVSITAKISCKWKLVQAKVFRNKSAITEYAIIDDDESDNKNELPDDLENYQEQLISELDESVNEDPSGQDEPLHQDVNQVTDLLNETNLETVQDEPVTPAKKSGRSKKT